MESGLFGEIYSSMFWLEKDVWRCTLSCFRSFLGAKIHFAADPVGPGPLLSVLTARKVDIYFHQEGTLSHLVYLKGT